MINKNKIIDFVNNYWDKNAIEGLSKYITIPCKTPGCDHDWEKNGFLLQAIEYITAWVHAQNIVGIETEVIQLEGKTPFLYIDVPGSDGKEKNTEQDTIIFYGHLDKMPESGEWDEGLGAWTPVLRGDRLYGRGAVDNGYAIFAAIGALKALHEQDVPHPRCVFLLETMEESGSADFPGYIDILRNRIGKHVKFIISMDSTTESYDRLWYTTSFRGTVTGKLSIEVLTKTDHSGTGGGMIPTTFTIMRQLLARIEDVKTGKVIPKDFYVAITNKCREETKATARILGNKVRTTLSLLKGVKALEDSNEKLLLRNFWEPSIAVLGMDGLPPTASAGNNIWANLNLKLSMRTPPALSSLKAFKKLKQILEKNPPFGAKVKFTHLINVDGFCKSIKHAWLQQVLSDACRSFFGKEPLYTGLGAGIPPMKMLYDAFPQAEMLITGLLGNNANVHGPNEFLDIPAAKKITCFIAHILAKFGRE
jgi:acetylornithine deacetylase/succinyl-diaminopimelate desuccinylase-like protein